MNNTTDRAASIAHYVQQFETLRADHLTPLMDCFADEARFVDPFNDVCGKAAIARIFAHMFETTDNPYFVVRHTTFNDDVVLITWTFYMTLKKRQKTLVIEGCSQVVMNDDGLVIEHKDFWDPCQGLYEQLPLIGRVFRMLRRRLRVD